MLTPHIGRLKVVMRLGSGPATRCARTTRTGLRLVETDLDFPKGTRGVSLESPAFPFEARGINDHRRRAIPSARFREGRARHSRFSKTKIKRTSAPSTGCARQTTTARTRFRIRRRRRPAMAFLIRTRRRATPRIMTPTRAR